MPDRLTPLDASFLHLEDASRPMHVACTMTFAGATPDADEFAERVAARLHLVPRYRQRLAFVPLDQGRPKWVDDEEFDIRHHVRTTALPAPGGPAQLRALTGRLFSQQLRRDRPLWEMWLIDGVAPQGGEERFAIFSKTHHALVDGISGMDILTALFAPDEAEEDPSAWRPQPAPSGLELLAEALWERSTRPAEMVRPLRAAVLRPWRVVGQAAGTVAGIADVALAGLRPAPRTPYNRSTAGPERSVGYLSVDLDDVKAIKNALGGTVNDVILATVARALRRDLERRGADVKELHTFVPVSTRQRGSDPANPANEVTGMVVRLPIACPDPVECLHRISAVTKEMKASGQAVGARTLTELTGLAPPTILTTAMRLSARQRVANLVVTNVPGPQQALSFEDRELLEIMPMIPVGQNLRLGVAIVSYHGVVSFGITADADLIPDAETIAEDFKAALTELGAAAGVEVHEPLEERAAHAAPATDAEPVPETTTEARVEAGEDGDGAAPAEEAAEALAPAAGDEDADDGLRGEPEPTHVDTGIEEVAEFSDPGAEEGAGPELRVEEPWENYRRMRAPDIVDRLATATEAEIAVVRLYESTHKRRRAVLEAAERAQRGLPPTSARKRQPARR